MSLLPGIHKRSFEHRRYLINHHPLVRGSDATLDGSSSSPLAPPHRILGGTVVVRAAQGSLFLPASDPRGARSLAPEVRSLVPPDAAWANTQIAVSLAQGLGFLVVLDQAAVTTADVQDQLNRHPLFQGHFLADDLGGFLRVRGREAGAHKVLHVQSSLAAAFGPIGSFGHGQDADYRVTDDTVEVRDLEGNPIEAVVPTLLVGHFDESELTDLTSDARAVLSRRGSFFG